MIIMNYDYYNDEEKKQEIFRSEKFLQLKNELLNVSCVFKFLFSLTVTYFASQSFQQHL